MFLPQSPRWLMDQGRDEECLAVLADLRRQPPDSPLVQIEYLEIKSQKVFEQRVSENDHPNLQDGTAKSNFLLGIAQYKSLITNRANLRRTLVAVLTMTFQQWTGKSRISADADSRCQFHPVLCTFHLCRSQSRWGHHIPVGIWGCRRCHVPRNYSDCHLSGQLGTKACSYFGRHSHGNLSFRRSRDHRSI